MPEMKFALTTLLIMNLGSINAQSTLLILFDDGTQSRLELAFEDDFASESIDRDKWLTSYPWGRHLVQKSVEGESLEYYTDGENCTINNGIISFIARKEKVCGVCAPWEDSAKVLQNGLPNYRCFDYSSGMLYSKQDFGYGWYEAKFKQSPQSKGLWPAFWLYGSSNEIDIFENKGERKNETHWDVHCIDGCKGKKGGWVNLPADFTQNFQTIGLSWHADGQRWYHNGINYKATRQPFNNKKNIILNLAVARDNDEEGFWVGPDQSTVFPSSFEVDYVRFYRLISTAGKMKKVNDEEIINNLRNGKQDHLKRKNDKPKRKKEIVAKIFYDKSTGDLKVEKLSGDVAVNIYNSSGNFIKRFPGSNDEQRLNTQDENIILIVKSGGKTYGAKL